MAKKRQTENGPTFEQSLDALEGVSGRVESGEVGLEESIEEYERGVELIRRCREILERAEQRVKRLSVEEIERSGGSSPSGETDDDDADEESAD